MRIKLLGVTVIVFVTEVVRMYWHIDCDIISLIVIAAIAVYYYKSSPTDRNTVRGKRFRYAMKIGLAISLIDIAASVIMEIPVPNAVYHFFMTLYFATIELAIVVWMLYTHSILYHDNLNLMKIFDRVIWSSYIIYALFALTNPITGLIYSLSPDRVYSRGPCFMIMTLLFAVYILLLFALVAMRWKHIPLGYPSAVFILVPFILTVSITVQLLVPGWLMIIPGYMICIVLTFLFLQNMKTRSSQELMQSLSKAAVTDQLTELYNRTGMEALLQKSLADDRGKSCIALIIDIDNLKNINDTLGHTQGDRAIKSVAAVLRGHFRVSDTVVRYGGDEFLVYLTGEFGKAQIASSLNRLVNHISEIRIGENNDYPVSGSIGAAFGVVGADDFTMLCNRADIALYHVKRNGKHGYAFYSPEIDKGSSGI